MRSIRTVLGCGPPDIPARGELAVASLGILVAVAGHAQGTADADAPSRVGRRRGGAAPMAGKRSAAAAVDLHLDIGYQELAHGTAWHQRSVLGRGQWKRVR